MRSDSWRLALGTWKLTIWCTLISHQDSSDIQCADYNNDHSTHYHDHYKGCHNDDCQADDDHYSQSYNHDDESCHNDDKGHDDDDQGYDDYEGYDDYNSNDNYNNRGPNSHVSGTARNCRTGVRRIQDAL